ncbi:hypothetical protein [Streptomyces sp. GZWMJZ-114]|uniref:hypothetical protein n=1 Tax=Streptomyces sp. GZWMJZ-114 TaxID=2494734 RepID=UPI00101188E4|nr:hypothetical protein [Streptomyces sp. GZWMJZ-114]
MTDAPDTPAHAPKGGGGGFKASLGKKVGPLPVGVWILAVGGGLVVAYFMRRGASGDGQEVTDDGTGAADTGGTGVGTWPYGYPNGVGQGGSSGSTDDGQDEDDDGTLPVTNEQWQRRAVQVLVGLGYEAVAVDRAIAAYLGGEGLTTIQRAIVNEAILRIGPPPVSPPSPSTPDKPPPTTTPPKTDPKPLPSTPTTTTKPKPKPKPTPKPTPKPASKNVYPKKWKTVVNGKGASYSSIAAKYKLHISGTELYQYQLSKSAGRPASTVATLKKRGPNLIYAAGTTVLPYPKG